MFYKIKSRNAHMKIHRQPQEDWAERRVQHQLLTQRLGSNLVPSQAPARTFSSSCLLGTTSNNSNADKVLNALTNSNAIGPNNVLNHSSLVTCSNNAVSNSHVLTDIDGGDSHPREPTTVLPFHQTWGPFGHGPDQSAFFCSTERKDNIGAGAVGAKEPINWQ